ncbi:MAG: aminoacyl-tRNA hydrolase [Elusimicrobiota bacterium]
MPEGAEERPGRAVPAIRVAAGLGNPGAAYRNTPHNIGFHALDAWAAASRWEWRERDDWLWTDAGGPVLVKPQTYMNVSGPAVREALRKRNASPEELLVVCDDFALPWGRLRIRRSGSSGGHNGLQSVTDALGSTDFPRLRVGVGPVPPGMDPKDFVLKKKAPKEMVALAEAAAEALKAVFEQGLEKAMNKFNAKPAEPAA